MKGQAPHLPPTLREGWYTHCVLRLSDMGLEQCIECKIPTTGPIVYARENTEVYEEKGRRRGRTWVRMGRLCWDHYKARRARKK